ncbi:MAG: NAD-dependent epimerase/dehydratase family protein, partial [Victivallales bacterium]|nr:NAD-dependent epimerase/dehydratase family protein [Victivallales bacterium]
MKWHDKKVLVTGGGGFLGNAIVAMLVRENCAKIRSLGRRERPDLMRMGVEVVRGDIVDYDTVLRAAKGVEVVFHTAAKAGVWGRPVDFHNTNVVGTGNVVAACKSANVPVLVHTSSPSVVFGEGSIENGDESLLYPDRYLAHYPRTKAEAERMVLEGCSGNFRAVSLRPHLIWGPGDPHLLPRVFKRAASGKLIQIGDGSNLVDLTFIENAASAHIKAAVALWDNSCISRKTYFISDGSPVRLWEWIGALLENLSLPPVRKKIPYPVARLAGAAMETLWHILRLSGEPPMTRFVAAQLAHSHYFNISRARQDFGYFPPARPGEALGRTVEYFAALSGP